MIGGNNPNLPYRYGSSYKSNTNLAANTADTIFSAAANVNGAILWAAETSFNLASGSIYTFGLLAKTSAPTSVIDGDVISANSGSAPAGSGQTGARQWNKPVFIPPGKGLYYIESGAEAGAYRSALYTLL